MVRDKNFSDSFVIFILTGNNPAIAHTNNPTAKIIIGNFQLLIFSSAKAVNLIIKLHSFLSIILKIYTIKNIKSRKIDIHLKKKLADTLNFKTFHVEHPKYFQYMTRHGGGREPIAEGSPRRRGR
jgi:hypothetical protein